MLTRPLFSSLIVSLFIVLLAGCASVAAPRVSEDASALRKGTYALDPAHASVLFKIDHLGFSTYVGRFERIDATLDFDSKNPERADVEAIIDMTSLDIANDDFADTLMGPDWFDAGQFPQARFVSREIAVTGDTTGVMTGDLTLKGETRPIRLAVTFNGGARDLLRGAYVVGFSATGSFDRTDFGISKFSGLITDDVAIEIEAEFVRQ
ncbi:MAG: YceI family protein [Pseudomonadota bacterium]